MAGIATSAGCLVMCGNILVPIFMSSRRGIAGNYLMLASFCAGRLIIYLLFGAGIGWIGSQFYSYGWYSLAVSCGIAAAGFLLLRYLRGTRTCAGHGAYSSKKWHTTPFMLGIISGANICAPFIVVITIAAGTGSMLQGIVCFLAFFSGTTLALLLLPLTGLLSRWHIWTNIGRLAGVVVGFMLIIQGFSGVYRQLHPGQQSSPGIETAAEKDMRNESYRKAYPGADRFTRSINNPALCNAYSGSVHIGYIADSRALPLRISGYAGPTPLILAADKTGAVVSITVLENNETPGYMADVEDSPWWNRYERRTLGQIVDGGQMPDAISGATMTSVALRQTLEAAAEALRRNSEPGIAWNQQAGAARVTGARAYIRSWNQWLPLILLLAMVIVLARHPGLLNGWLKWIVWVFSVVFLGFYRSNYFSIGQIAAVIHGATPSPVYLGWHILFIFALVSPLFIGRAYCRYVCPFGVLSEVLHRVIPFSVTLPPAVARWLKWLKYILLAAALVLILAFPSLPVDRFEPFQAIFIRVNFSSYVVFGITVLAVSIFIKRFWCVLFCLDGALFEQICRYKWQSRPVRPACAEKEQDTRTYHRM